uniref:Amidohydrolase family protein n=1 Tax=uncultured organism TaxID=155900 RepID=M1QC01_9ZZZZ|nr:amidohydrolase family protein [uncultured organism]
MKAYQEAGLRVYLALDIRDQSQLIFGNDDQFLGRLPGKLRNQVIENIMAETLSLEDFKNVFRELIEDEPAGVNLCFGPPGPHWCSDQILKTLVRMAREYNRPIFTHLAETESEYSYGPRYYGESLITHLQRLGFLDIDLTAAHGVHLKEVDLDQLGAHGVNLVHNPSSNLRLQSGIAPVSKMRERGINIALGTDNLSLDDRDDIWQEMRLASVLAGLKNERLDPYYSLQMVTSNGAGLLGRSGELGSIERGKKADLTLINLTDNILSSYMRDDVDPVEVLTARCRPRDVESVVIDGKIVYNNYEHVSKNREEIVRKQKENLEKEYNKSNYHEKKEIIEHLIPYVEEYYSNPEK